MYGDNLIAIINIVSTGRSSRKAVDFMDAFVMKMMKVSGAAEDIRNGASHAADCININIIIVIAVVIVIVVVVSIIIMLLLFPSLLLLLLQLLWLLLLVSLLLLLL